MTQLDRFGIELTLPEGATWSYNANYPRADIAIAADEVAHVDQIDAAPPASLDDAAKKWDGICSKQQVLEQGATEAGGFYSARQLEVRVGVPGGLPGDNLHGFKDIVRVYGILPLSAERYVQCTVFIEFGAGADHPSVQRGLALCKSLAKA